MVHGLIHPLLLQLVWLVGFWLLLPGLSHCYLVFSLLFFSLFTGRMVLVALELPAKHRRGLHPSSALSRDPLTDWFYLISISIAFLISLTKYQTRSNFRKEECTLHFSRGCIPPWQARHGRRRRGMVGHTASTGRKQGANRKCGWTVGPECTTSAILRPLEQFCERNVENFAAESSRNHTREVFLLSSHKPVLKEGT